jgi:hypothetical protein
VKDYVRTQGLRSQEMFVPLVHAPGEAQADFGEALAVVAGERKAHYLAMKSGDAAVEGSREYADYRHQLISEDEAATMSPAYRPTTRSSSLKHADGSARSRGRQTAPLRGSKTKVWINWVDSSDN